MANIKPLDPFPDDLVPGGRTKRRRPIDSWCLMKGNVNADSWPVKEAVETLRDERRAAGRNAATG